MEQDPAPPRRQPAALPLGVDLIRRVPVTALDEINEEGALVRRDPRLPEAQAEFTLMADLSAEGITDYVARPLGMISGVRSSVTYASDSPHRFREADLTLIERSLPILLLNLDSRIMLNVALHRGEVFFGNIGAPARVDFTVIGAAVNLAARVEPLTKTLDRPLLLIEAVARLTARPLVSLGTFPLRGVSAPIAIFAPK